MTDWYQSGPFGVHIFFFFSTLEQIRTRSVWEGSCWHWTKQTFVWAPTSAHGPSASLRHTQAGEILTTKAILSPGFLPLPSFSLSSVTSLSCSFVSPGHTLRALQKHWHWPFFGRFFLQPSGFSSVTQFGKTKQLLVHTHPIFFNVFWMLNSW